MTPRVDSKELEPALDASLVFANFGEVFESFVVAVDDDGDLTEV